MKGSGLGKWIKEVERESKVKKKKKKKTNNVMRKMSVKVERKYTKRNRGWKMD